MLGSHDLLAFAFLCIRSVLCPFSWGEGASSMKKQHKLFGTCAFTAGVPLVSDLQQKREKSTRRYFTRSLFALLQLLNATAGLRRTAVPRAPPELSSCKTRFNACLHIVRQLMALATDSGTSSHSRPSYHLSKTGQIKRREKWCLRSFAKQRSV